MIYEESNMFDYLNVVFIMGHEKDMGKYLYECTQARFVPMLCAKCFFKSTPKLELCRLDNPLSKISSSAFD